MPDTLSQFDALFRQAGRNVPAVRSLGGGAIRTDAEGAPLRQTGRHALVYEMRAHTGRILALRVFRTPDPARDAALARHYETLHNDTQLIPLRDAGTLPREVQWMTEGVLRDGGSPASLPLLAMERVPGRTLRQTAVRLGREADAAHFAMLADSWLAAALALEEHGFVHGDLTADNLMVRPDGGIALVDLDTATWPGYRPHTAGDAGSSVLRHPYGFPRDPARRDRFPALMLWAALRVLAQHPDALDDAPGDAPGLLWTPDDLRRPASSPRFQWLEDHGDPSLRLLLEVVRRALRFSPDDLPPLAEIAERLDGLGFPQRAQVPRTTRPPRATTLAAAPVGNAEPAPTAPQPTRPASPAPSVSQPAPKPAAAAAPAASPSTATPAHAAALRQALTVRDGAEARRIAQAAQQDPAVQTLAALVHQLTEADAAASIDRAMRRRDDPALLHAVEQAERAGVALTATVRAAARAARERQIARERLTVALTNEDREALGELHRSGQLDELGPHPPATNRAVARALAWPALERALAQDDDAAICAAADPALWREDETRPHVTWQRLDLAWQRARWSRDVRASLRQRDAASLRAHFAKAPDGAALQLTEIERRRVERVIAREAAAGRLERALRAGPDREVVEALAELEASGAPFSDELDWVAVRGVVDRLSLADALRAAMAANPLDTVQISRLLPAARTALGGMQGGGPNWAELEATVLRAAHLERLREALATGEDSRIAAAADPDPFAARDLLTPEEAAKATAALARVRARPGARPRTPA
ncbi:MAG: phosphotransferase [Thermomicrobiales bacterium]